MKDLVKQNAVKECVRTELANSRWFDDLLMTGQFYNPLTKLKNVQRPRSNKNLSVSETSTAANDFGFYTAHAPGTSRSTHRGNTTVRSSKSKYVNVAHMIYDFKTMQGGDNLKQQMTKSVAKNCFNRETDFKSLPTVAERLSAPSKSPPPQYGSKLKRKPYVAPNADWVLNTGLCPSQADAVKREKN